MTPEQEAAIREQHRATPYFTPDDHTGEACTNDGTEWPCDASLILAELDAARAERDRLTAALLAIFDLTADRPNVREIARAALTKEGWT